MAMFSQMLHENGLIDPEDGKMWVPPGVLGLSGGIVYDPVSKGYKGNAAFSPTSQHITEVQATSEYRRWFKDVDHDADPNVSTVEVMGNHRNIGGGHDEQGISARVLESSTQWFVKAGIPLDELPEHMRYRADEPARIYEERDLPGMERTRKFSGSHLVLGTVAALAGGGIIKPIEALIPKSISVLAGKADYPRTHDPREGLDAPRQQRPSARHQEQMADGWQRFEGVNGVVWSKDYSGANQWNITRVVVAERNFPGRKNDRIDMYQIHGNGQVDHYQQHIAAGRKMQRLGTESRQRADQGFGATPDQLLIQGSLQTREQKTSQELDQKVEQRLQRQLEPSAGSQEINTDGQNISQSLPASKSGPVAVTAIRQDATQRKEIAQAFKADPDAALAQYPGNERINAAKVTLDEVNQRYAGAPRGASLVKRMHNELTNRIARGAAIPNPQQAFGMIHRAMARGSIGE